MSYAALKAAIQKRQSVTFYVRGKVRHVSPHAIGTNSKGVANVMTFQYAGDGSKPLPIGGEWRCFEVADVSGVRENGDPWHTNPFEHSERNTCVTHVDASTS